MKGNLSCQNFSISRHALKAMIQRGISVDDVLEVGKEGEITADYPSDKPYAGCLLL
ncbi:MAG: hypothetical protein JWQ40_32 [Segetibacter sp.]|jgi:hypothetical protein|nr:hypothetical protein [Segetibacter sp.]